MIQRKVRTYFELLATLRSRQKSNVPLMIGLDGLGGTGKSFFADRLAVLSPDITVIHFDDFFLPSNEIPKSGYPPNAIGPTSEWQRLVDQVIAPLRFGKVARYQRFNWVTDQREEFIEVAPSGLVIVEGVYSLRKELIGLYDFRIWTECPPSARLERGIRRDGENSRLKWETEWIPAEENYRELEKPFDRAELIIDCSGQIDHDIGNTFVEMAAQFPY